MVQLTAGTVKVARIIDIRFALAFAKRLVGIYKTIHRRQISRVTLALVLRSDGTVLLIRSDPRVQ